METMKTRKCLVFVPALVALAFVQACSPAIHEGITDTDLADRLGQASTSIDIPARCAGSEVKGVVQLAAGTAEVVFTMPDGQTKKWVFEHGPGSTGVEEFPVGYQTTAGPGTYLLAISGSDNAIGGYELSLYSYP